MSHRSFVLCGLAAAAVLIAARGEAQPLVILPDHISLGGSIAASSNADGNSGTRAADLAVHFEVPVFQPYRIRFDAGRVTWRFGSPYTSRTPLVDNVTLTRATASVVKVIAPRTLRNPLAGYAGAGYGLYRWRFDQGRPPVPNRAGYHVLAGIEFVGWEQRVALNWELQLHAVRGPGDGVVNSYGMLVLQGTFGIKYLF